MVNSVIFDYLRNNKAKYNIDDLKKEILSKGYNEGDFNDALAAISAVEPQKFQPGELNKLPTSNFVTPNYVGGGKKGFGIWKFLLIALGILLLGVVVVLAMNFFDVEFFGFNFFKLFK